MCSGSFMMKERFETKVDLAGKEYWPTVVGTVVEWNKEKGPTHEILCTSAMVACSFQIYDGISKCLCLCLDRLDFPPECMAGAANLQPMLFLFQEL